MGYTKGPNIIYGCWEVDAILINHQFLSYICHRYEKSQSKSYFFRWDGVE